MSFLALKLFRRMIAQGSHSLQRVTHSSGTSMQKPDTSRNMLFCAMDVYVNIARLSRNLNYHLNGNVPLPLCYGGAVESCRRLNYEQYHEWTFCRDTKYQCSGCCSSLSATLLELRTLLARTMLAMPWRHGRLNDVQGLVAVSSS